MSDISLLVAFGAGLASFLSPCVLPLVPGYISFISGVSLGQQHSVPATGVVPSRWPTIFNALLFVIGFSLVFVILGATATWIGAFVSTKLSILTKAAGLIIIFFGLLKMGVIRTLFFYREARFRMSERKYGPVGALLIGACFGFGWTPCIGPILGGILVYAGTMSSAGQGIGLLSTYALGLGMPFLITAFGVNSVMKFFNRIQRHLGTLEKATGLIMVFFGILIFSNKLVLLVSYLPFLNRFAL